MKYMVEFKDGSAMSSSRYHGESEAMYVRYMRITYSPRQITRLDDGVIVYREDTEGA